jgi:membrane fusion protein (multidrug efflux system)
MRGEGSGDAPGGLPTGSGTVPGDVAGIRAPTRGARLRRALLRFVLLVAVPAAALGGAAHVWLQGGGVAQTDNAYVKADKIPVGAEVPGTVRAVPVRENERVAAGAVLLRLDDAPLRVALARAEARLAQARADVAALRAGYRAKQAEIELARARVEFARRDEARQADLAARNFISAARHDEARQATELATRQTVAVERDLARIAETLGGGPEVPVERHPLVLAAQAELMQARLDLSRVEVRAPVAGIVSRPPKPGQFLAAGATALALVADTGLWVEANFTETELGAIRSGQPARIRIDTYPGLEWQGAVESLSPATGAEFAVIPPHNASGNWIKVTQRVPVRIRIDPIADAPTLRAGLSARVTVETGRRRTLSDLLP